MRKRKNGKYDLKESMIEDYVKWLLIEERSRATVAKYRRDLYSFYRFLCESGEEKVDKELVIRYKEILCGSYGRGTASPY